MIEELRKQLATTTSIQHTKRIWQQYLTAIAKLDDGNDNKTEISDRANSY